MTAEQYIKILSADSFQYPKAYKYVDLDGGMAMLRNSTVRFTSACDLNDEYDCNAAVLNYDTYRRIGMSLGISTKEIERIIEKEGNEINHWGICSLCKTADNKTLWGNYANGNGLCIEIDVPKTIATLDSLGKQTPLITVSYFEDVKSLIRRDLGISSNDLFRYAMIKGLVGAKSSINATNGWKSELEDEIRLVLFERIEENAPLYLKLPHECFTSVYCDERLSQTDLKTLHQLISRKYHLTPKKRELSI